jgi:hypothetical protein
MHACIAGVVFLEIQPFNRQLMKECLNKQHGFNMWCAAEEEVTLAISKG